MTEPTDNTRSSGTTPATDELAAERGVGGGSADRLDSPGEGSGGVPAAGADGVTEEREQLRKDLGERADSQGEEGGGGGEQAPGVGDNDPQGGSVQEHGSRP